jgi:hypothetical protein
MSLLPCSANRLMRKVLIDLLPSSALSVPTSSLHSFHSHQYSPHCCKSSHLPCISSTLVIRTSGHAMLCFHSSHSRRQAAMTRHVARARLVWNAQAKGPSPANVSGVDVILLEQRVHCCEAHGHHIFLVPCECHVLLAQPQCVFA